MNRPDAAFQALALSDKGIIILNSPQFFAVRDEFYEQRSQLTETLSSDLSRFVIMLYRRAQHNFPLPFTYFDFFFSFSFAGTSWKDTQMLLAKRKHSPSEQYAFLSLFLSFHPANSLAELLISSVW
jgi:hypothetical protein